MLGVIAIADVLDMLIVDHEDDDTVGCITVRDVLDHKHKSEHYDTLVHQVRAAGFEVPILTRTFEGTP
jgi:CBS domain containing-hemolysin-like protein